MTIKNIRVQIGNKFYSLKFEFETKDIKELKLLIESKQFDLKLLEKEVN